MDQARQPLERPEAVDRDESFSLLTALGFMFLTFNSGMAIYRSQGDPWSIAFITFSYTALVLLFYLMRMYERDVGPVSSRDRQRLKMAVWALTTLLSVMFSYKVAAIMPLAEALLVWAMTGATVSGVFYAFFVHTELPSTASSSTRRP